MICDKHERVVRVGRCSLCVKETEDSIQLDFEIRQLERELKQPIQLWPVLS